MKHRLGNSPKCKECFFWRDHEPGEKVPNGLDGWCTNKHQCQTGVNGRKREHPPEREPCMWNGNCKYWEDAENHLTRFEVDTLTPEEWRTDGEKEYINGIFQKYKDESKRRMDEWVKTHRH